MSRAFVKEDDDRPSGPRLRKASGLPNYVTRRGLRRLREEEERLSERCSRLMAAGRKDGRREPELEQALADLSYYQERLRSAMLSDGNPPSSGEVRFGAAVKVSRGGRSLEYRIVGEDEAEPSEGRLSWASPLASVLLGRKPGDTVSFNGRAGKEMLLIEAVGYAGEEE